MRINGWHGDGVVPTLLVVVAIEAKFWSFIDACYQRDVRCSDPEAMALIKRQSDALLADHFAGNFVTVSCVVRKLVHQSVKILGSYAYDNRTRLLFSFSLVGTVLP